MSAPAIVQAPITADGSTPNIGWLDKEPPAVAGADATSNGDVPNGRADADDGWMYPYPTDFKIEEHPIDEARELKVAVIGAGLAGINAGVLLPVKVPGIKLTIFEKNNDVGGVWLTNRYPGVRCDVNSHCYQTTYAPKIDWTEEYAQGHEIRHYWQSVARKYDVYSKCRFNTKVLSANWNGDKSKWTLTTKDLLSKEDCEDDFDFLITANGHFDDFKMPSYPGIEDYQGHIRHSSDWDESFDPRGKRIATIGNGASGIQVTTELQKHAAHVDHYARNKTWIAGAIDPNGKERKDVEMPYTQEDLESFKDPEKYLAYRKGLESAFFRRFDETLRDSDKAITSRERFKEIMRERLGGDEALLERMVPDFPPFCRRLTPGPGYLEALVKPNLTYIQDPISHFTAMGIVTKSGEHRPVDAVICSTGANIDFAPPFPIVSGKFDLQRDWKPTGAFTFPYTYLGIATPHFPNLAFLLGPNPPGTTGTIPHAVEQQVTYLAKLLRKMSSQGIASMTPSRAAADDWTKYCDAFFPRTNMSRKCSSWYNGGVPGARIHGIWPGSSAQAAHALREPRWEDWEMGYAEGRNRFGYLGNGWTRKELEGGDLTPYLRLEGENDLRDLHERWWDL